MPRRRTVRARHRRARPPSQGVAPGLALCHQLLPWHRQTSTAPRFLQPVPWTTCVILGGRPAVFASGLWAQCGRGAIMGALPPPHHLLTICPRKPSFPLCHCCPRPQREALGFLAGPCCALPSPTASALQPQVPPPAAGRQGCVCPLLFEPGTVKGPVRGFSEGRRSGVQSGLILNQSNMRSLLASPCVDGNCSAHSHSHIRSTVSVPGLMLSFTFTMVYNVHNTPTIWVWLLLPSFLLRGKMDLESEAICPPSHSSMWNQHN